MHDIVHVVTNNQKPVVKILMSIAQSYIVLFENVHILMWMQLYNIIRSVTFT